MSQRNLCLHARPGDVPQRSLLVPLCSQLSPDVSSVVMFVGRSAACGASPKSLVDKSTGAACFLNSPVLKTPSYCLTLNKANKTKQKLRRVGKCWLSITLYSQKSVDFVTSSDFKSFQEVQERPDLAPLTQSHAVRLDTCSIFSGLRVCAARVTPSIGLSR